MTVVVTARAVLLVPSAAFDQYIVSQAGQSCVGALAGQRPRRPTDIHPREIELSDQAPAAMAEPLAVP
jgi:hypothetical protein